MSKFGSLKPMEWAALLLLWVGVTTLFVVTLPHLDSDRESENCYLQIPYREVVKHDLHVWGTDPFAENSPLLVYILAEITYHAHSITPLRYTQFLFIPLNLLLIFLLFKKYADIESWPQYSIFLMVLAMYEAWLVIPGIQVYFVQTNGMAGGVACFLTGLLLLDDHPYWAMFAFGAAYQFKGQFLAMYPAMIGYWLFLERPEMTLGRHLGRVLRLGAVFFAVPMVLSPLLLASLGWFHSGADFREYALLGPLIIRNEAIKFYDQFVFHKVQTFTSGIRKQEFAGFGLLTKAIIAISIGTCLIWLTQAVRDRLHPKSSACAPRAFKFYGAIALFYWFHYLCFWDFPYWYNVFAIIFMNVFIFPYWTYRIGELVRLRISKAAFERGLVAAIILLALMTAYQSHHHWKRAIKESGTILMPYPWMNT